MNEHPVTGSESDICRGSAWAALDEAFFRMTQDTFSHVFCEGATALLASNDDAMPERPAVIELPETPTIYIPTQAEHDAAAARRAAMRRHPSSRRRF